MDKEVGREGEKEKRERERDSKTTREVIRGKLEAARESEKERERERERKRERERVSGLVVLPWQTMARDEVKFLLLGSPKPKRKTTFDLFFRSLPRHIIRLTS